MTYTRSKRVLGTFLLSILALVGLVTVAPSAGASILYGPRDTSMTFAGGSPTEATRDICVTNEMGGGQWVAQVITSSRSNGAFSLKVKDEAGTTLATWDQVNSATTIPGSVLAGSCRTLTFRNGWVDGAVPAASYTVKLSVAGGTPYEEDDYVASFSAGAPSEQIFSLCNTDPFDHNLPMQVDLNTASVANGAFQLKVKERTVEEGDILLDTLTSAPDQVNYGDTKNGQCTDFVIRNGYVNGSVPAVTYTLTAFSGT